MTLWAAEDGWPYPDALGDFVDVAGEADDDLLSLSLDRHLLDDLDAVEREVVVSHFGLEGHEVRTMKQLRNDLHLPRGEIRDALGSGLEKLRVHLST